MSAYTNRLSTGLKSVALWWFLSAYVSGVVGAIVLGKEAAILNIVGTTLFSVFFAIGVCVGAKGSEIANSVNLADPKVEESEPVVKTLDNPILLYEAYVEFKGGADSLIICAKDKEAGKRLLIEKYPFGKILFFTPLKVDRDFIFVANSAV